MTQTQSTLARLEAAMNAPGVPPRVAERCRGLIDKLRRPVRVGLFGLPGCGKGALVNALAGMTVDPPDLPLPTFELCFGERPFVTATRADGSTFGCPGLPDAGVLADRPIFLRIEAPLTALGDMSFLKVSAPAAEVHAALHWAAPRCDIALWCTRDWTEVERLAWAGAPEALKDHAHLVLRNDGSRDTLDAAELARVRARTDNGFGGIFPVTALRVVGAERAPRGARMRGIDALTARLRQDIDAALAEDVDAALLLLHRYEPRPGAGAEGAQPAPPAAPPRPAPDKAAMAALSRAFLLVRQAARELLAALPDPAQAGDAQAEDAAAAILDRCAETMETLAGLAEPDDRLAETWPDLHDAILEASELSVLLRIEGGIDQAADAAALLLQLRRDIEGRLAA